MSAESFLFRIVLAMDVAALFFLCVAYFAGRRLLNKKGRATAKAKVLRTEESVRIASAITELNRSINKLRIAVSAQSRAASRRHPVYQRRRLAQVRRRIPTPSQ